MRMLLLAAAPLLLGGLAAPLCAETTLRVGFGEVDITPPMAEDRPVWMAGYLPGRRATGVHDPLYARCIVLEHDERRIAFASLDLIGLQYPVVQKIRGKLADFEHVTITSTHNHQGPDVIGIWGPSFVSRGVDEAYLELVVNRTAAMIDSASKAMKGVNASFGTAADPSLVADRREPFVKDDVLRALRFTSTLDGSTEGIVVQWNCHPEAMGARNTQITADFPAATVDALKKHFDCPVVYFSGAVGGLMAPPTEGFETADGRVVREGEFAYSERLGQEVARLAARALTAAEPIELAPFVVSAAPIAVPVTNPYYRAARATGVVRREGRVWTGDFRVLGAKVSLLNAYRQTAVETEIGYLRLGELHLACIPGEIYPELVYGKVQDPADPRADHAEAPMEKSVSEILPGDRWMLFGLANDEIGYILPRRQWDRQPPYAYGRDHAQYGEINSCGPFVGPVITQALEERVRKSQEIAGDQ